MVLLCLVAGACQSSSPSPAVHRPNPLGFAREVQAAVDHAKGYELTIAGHNLVLPRWGGVDDGTLRIAIRGPRLEGVVHRTGDGTYAVRYVLGQSYFRRYTCSRYSRVPGGGHDVFTMFLWSETNAIGNAHDVGLGGDSPPGTLLLKASLTSLGPVTITVNRSTLLPTRLVTEGKVTSGSVSQWTFSHWGQVPDVSAPEGPTADQGPGGNPC